MPAYLGPVAHRARLRILGWSLLSGLLWALAWPGIGGLAPFALVAWLPLFHAERLHDSLPGRKPFVPYALAALFLWNAACSWWFFFVSEPMATKVVSVTAPVVVNTLLMAVPWWLKRLVRRRVGRQEADYAFILFWLAFERLHHDWDLQWPWFSLGNVFANMPALIQWYSFTGMLGGSLWVLLANLLLHWVLVAYRTGPLARPQHYWAAALWLLVPIALSLGIHATHTEQGTPVEVAVVQPSIDPYGQKFGGMDPMQQVQAMLDLTAQVVTPNTRLVVWPETALQESVGVDLSPAVPKFRGLWENDIMGSRSAQLIAAFQIRNPHLAVLTGMSSAYLFPKGARLPITARPLGDQGHHYESYNAALWMPAEGGPVCYHKSKLVAGVELMPFQRVLGSLDHMALDLGGTTGSLGRQKERSVLADPGSGIRAVPVICYESVFGEHVAAHVRNGGNLITIMTNDAWWGHTPGHLQHLSFARIRAIETRRAVARSANTGISCFVDQRGGMHEVTEWWQADARRHTVMLNAELTFFVRHGDVVGRTALWCSALMLFLALSRWARGRHATR